MALTSSGAISMGDMRTEFGMSGAISMSDLYRGGSNVITSKLTQLSSVSHSGGVNSDGYGGERYWNGNFESPTTTNINVTYGYIRGGATPAAAITNASPGHVASDFASTIFYSIRSSQNGANTNSPVTYTLVFPLAGTYHLMAYDYESNGSMSLSGASSGNFSVTVPYRSFMRKTFATIANDTITIVHDIGDVSGSGGGENIASLFTIDTSSQADGAWHSSGRTITGLNTGVPASGTIDFDDFYGATG